MSVNLDGGNTAATTSATFAISDCKLCVPAVNLSKDDEIKLSTNLKSGFKREIIWNKYRSQVTTEAVNNNLNILIDPKFTNVNRLFVLAYQTANDRQSYSKFYLPRVSLLGNPVLDGNITKRSVKVVVPLKYLSNFFRSLEMLLINCKIKLNLTWKKECALSADAGDAVFIINDTKMYVSVVTLSKEDNKDFIEQQNKGFQRSIYWNEYKTKEINENADANVFKYINLDPSFQGVNKLFVMAYDRVDGQPTRNGQQKYYLPRIDLEKYNVIIDGRNFYDNPI